MTLLHDQQNNTPEGLICLEGEISQYRHQVKQANFMLTESENSKMGVVALVAAAMGEGAAAAGTMSQTNQTEEAYYVEFNLGDKRCKGWVWVSLFENGDFVKVAAEKKSDGNYQIYSIYRPRDGMIALFPHCSRGRKAHYRACWRYLGYAILGYFILQSLLVIYATSGDVLGFIKLSSISILIGIVMLSIIGYSLIRKWMVFVKLSEKIFKTFGFKDVESIDLPQITQKSFKKGEMASAALGVYIYRYLPDVNE